MIGIYSDDRGLRESLSSIIEITNVHKSFPIIDGLFIDWESTNDRERPSKKFVHQAALVNHYAKKKIPIVIYDRNISINKVEYDWLIKFNVFLFEPALNNRSGFGYMPHWIKPFDLLDDSLDNISDRNIDIGYVGDRNTPSFEKYYIEYMKKYNKRNVVCNDSVIDWSKVRYTMAIDNQFSYKIGYINENIVNALNSGCMVLLPKENRYHQGMFYPYVVNNIEEIEYFVSMENEYVRVSSLLCLYDNIEKNFPEFSLNYTIELIKGCYK